MIRRTMKAAIGAAIATVFVVGVAALFAPASASSGNCICPLVYAPVKCSNGKTYPNACVASCHHATGCVPSGEIQ